MVVSRRDAVGTHSGFLQQSSYDTQDGLRCSLERSERKPTCRVKWRWFNQDVGHYIGGKTTWTQSKAWKLNV